MKKKKETTCGEFVFFALIVVTFVIGLFTISDWAFGQWKKLSEVERLTMDIQSCGRLRTVVVTQTSWVEESTTVESLQNCLKDVGAF